MNYASRDFFISRIVSGEIWVENYCIKRASRQLKYQANILYKKLYEELKYDYTYREGDILNLLKRNCQWNMTDEAKYKKIDKDIEDAKINLYQLYFKSNTKKGCRDVLEVMKKDQHELSHRRHQYDHLLLDNILLVAKNSYLLLNTTYKNDKLIDDAELNMVFELWSKNRINESEYRNLARNEPWRSMWSCSIKDELFGIPTVDYTEEQKSIVFWSKMYDNIYENSECPSDSIVEDDDALDGWLIMQRRRREREAEQSMADKLIGRHGDADEIFVPVDTIEDARKINDLNDMHNKMLKKKKMDMVQHLGRVPDIMLPDMQEKLSKAVVEKQRQHFKTG